MKLSELWAKTDPFQSVVTHGLAAGVCAQTLFSAYLSDSTQELLCDSLLLSEEEVVRFIGYFVSLHDIGKISQEFQNHNSIFEHKVRHEKTTQKIMTNMWKTYCRDNNVQNKNISSYLAAILGAHHQGKNGEADIVVKGSEWDLLHVEYENLMRTYFCDGSFVFPHDIKNPQGVFEAILLGLTILSDWIVSGEHFSKAEQWNIDGVLKEKVEGMVSSLLENSGMKYNGQAEFGDSFKEYWPNIETLRGLQKQVEKLFLENDIKPILLLIEAPMGEGKTEAAIFAAEKMAKLWGKSGFYMGLPTAATANQMDDRVQKFFDMHGIDENVKLLHSTAWLFDHQQKQYDTEEEQYIGEWLNSAKRGLLSTNAVGTVDQAMLAARDVRYGILRLLGLMGKVLIIDEIHAYDLFMSNILERLFHWCKALEIPVILLSATLPWKKKKRLIEVFSDKDFENVYPAITCVDEKGDVLVKEITEVSMRQTYKIRMPKMLNMPDEIAKLALSRVENGGYLCVLVNTVRQAQETYNAIEKVKTDEDVILFHARFKAKDRAMIEEMCIRKFGKENTERKGKTILVATQVVEQSLDVDFDMMITAIAPMDLLMQRIGRVFRHKETVRPKTIIEPVIDVLVPENESYGVDGCVYEPVVLKQTQYLLQNMKKLTIPNNLQKLVNDAYNEDAVPKTEREKWKKYEICEQLEGAEADYGLLSLPEKKLSPICGKANFRDEGGGYLRSRTRNGEESIRVVLVSDEEFTLLKARAKKEFVRITDIKKATRLMENSLNVSAGRMESILPDSDPSLFLVGTGKLSGSIILPEKNAFVTYNNMVGLIWNGGDENEPNL